MDTHFLAVADIGALQSLVLQREEVISYDYDYELINFSTQSLYKINHFPFGTPGTAHGVSLNGITMASLDKHVPTDKFIGEVKEEWLDITLSLWLPAIAIGDSNSN